MALKQKNNFLTRWAGGLSNKTIFIISLLAMADVLVMAVPFYLKNVLSAKIISDSLGIELYQFSQANAIYGYIALPSYFIGGYFADKVSLKKLSIFGLLIIGLGSIWYGFIPFINAGKLIQIYIIFGIWSFATNFVFWSALWKLLSQQGKSTENGKINGVHGSLNGLIGTVIMLIAYGVFYLIKELGGERLEKWAFPTLVFIFTIIIFINCILIWKFVPDDKEVEESENRESFGFSNLANVMKNYKVWLVSFLVLGVYMYQTGLSVFITFMQDALLISVSVVFILGILRTYLFRCLFSSYFGKMADRSQKYVQFIIVGLFIASILTIIAIFVPGFGNYKINEYSGGWKLFVQIIVVISYLALGIVCWALVTNRWATIYVADIKQNDYGMAVGFISFVAFSADAWFWQIDSWALTNYGTIAGYKTDKFANQISLTIVLVTGIIGMIAGLILLLAMKKEKNKLLRSRNINN